MEQTVIEDHFVLHPFLILLLKGFGISLTHMPPGQQVRQLVMNAFYVDGPKLTLKYSRPIGNLAHTGLHVLVPESGQIQFHHSIDVVTLDFNFLRLELLTPQLHCYHDGHHF